MICLRKTSWFMPDSGRGGQTEGSCLGFTFICVPLWMMNTESSFTFAWLNEGYSNCNLFWPTAGRFPLVPRLDWVEFYPFGDKSRKLSFCSLPIYWAGSHAQAACPVIWRIKAHAEYTWANNSLPNCQSGRSVLVRVSATGRNHHRTVSFVFWPLCTCYLFSSILWFYWNETACSAVISWDKTCDLRR